MMRNLKDLSSELRFYYSFDHIAHVGFGLVLPKYPEWDSQSTLPDRTSSRSTLSVILLILTSHEP